MTALLTDSLVNEAAEEMICKLFPGDERWAGTSPEYHRKGFIKGAFHARSIYEARLAEAISLMKEAAPAIDLISVTLSERFDRFLAICAKEDKP